MIIKGDKIEFTATLELTGREVLLLNLLSRHFASGYHAEPEVKRQIISILNASSPAVPEADWLSLFASLATATNATVKKMDEAVKTFKNGG